MSRRIGGVLLAVVALGACGGDTPEDLQASFAEAAPTLAFVDESEASCVSEAVLTNVGFEQLSAAGYTSERILLDPSLAQTIFDDNDSPELREAITECLDPDSVFRERLAERNGGQKITCTEEFAAGDPLVDEVITQRIDNAPSELTIEDTTEHRDLFRPCLTEVAFAEMFDIDLAEDLAVAIDAKLGDLVRDDDKPCVGPLVLDALGSAEAANDAGISVANPSFTMTSIGLTGDDVDAFALDVFSCSSFTERETHKQRLAEPEFGPCVLDDLDSTDSWKIAKAQAALGSTSASRTVSNRERRALDDCLQAKIVLLFGEPSTTDMVTAKSFGEGYFESMIEDDPGLATYGNTLAEVQCGSYGGLIDIDVDQWFEWAWQMDQGLDVPAEFFRIADQIVVNINRSLRACTNDFDFMVGALQRGNFGDSTIDCVRGKVDATELADIYDKSLVDYESVTVTETDALWYSVYNALELCYEADEQKQYDDWVTWFETPLGGELGEPDSLST